MHNSKQSFNHDFKWVEDCSVELDCLTQLVDVQPDLNQCRVFVGILQDTVDMASFREFLTKYGEIVENVTIKDILGYVIRMRPNMIDQMIHNRSHLIDNYVRTKLKEYFSQFAVIDDIVMLEDKNGNTIGFGYVVFDYQNGMGHDLVKDLRNQLEKHQSIVQALENKYAELKESKQAEMEDLKSEITSLRQISRQLNFYKAQSDYLSEENNMLREEITKVTEKLGVAQDELATQRQRLELERETVVNEKSKLEEELSQIKESLSQCETEKQSVISTKDSEIDNLTQEVKNVNSLVEGKIQENQQLDNTIQTLKESLLKLESDNSTLQSDKENLNFEILKQNALVSELASKLNECEYRLQKLQNEQWDLLNAHTVEISQLLFDQESLNNQNNQLKEHISQLIEELVQARAPKEQAETCEEAQATASTCLSTSNETADLESPNNEAKVTDDSPSTVYSTLCSVVAPEQDNADSENKVTESETSANVFKLVEIYENMNDNDEDDEDKKFLMRELEQATSRPDEVSDKIDSESTSISEPIVQCRAKRGRPRKYPPKPEKPIGVATRRGRKRKADRDPSLTVDQHPVLIVQDESSSPTIEIPVYTDANSSKTRRSKRSVSPEPSPAVHPESEAIESLPSSDQPKQPRITRRSKR